jgi:Uncharacterized membrane-associated protein/domain
MIEYLREIFGEDIEIEPYVLKEGPAFLQYEYTANRLTWREHACIVVAPRNSEIRLPNLKKQFKLIQDNIELPCALELELMTSMQRKNLIENRIPFIAAPNQVYLPFWGSVFMEKYSKHTSIPKVMTATTQLVFLYIFYLFERKNVQVTHGDIVRVTGVPKSSCSRAIRELEAYDLIVQRKEGTTKYLSLKGGQDVINRAWPHMKSPIGKRLYLRDIPQSVKYKLGGIVALARQSMLAENDDDGSLVFSKSDSIKIDKSNIISEREFKDFGGVASEVWKYDPSILSDTDFVDNISLLLCLQDYKDERVQIELDNIRSRYGLVEEQ